MPAAASEKISGIVNNMPIPESTQIAVIAMGRLEGEAGSNAGCSVTMFFSLTAGWGSDGRLATPYSKSIGSASPWGRGSL